MTKIQRVYDALDEKRGDWVSVRDLMKKSDAVAVHSMVHYLRKKGMKIDNKEERKRNKSGDAVVYSSYKITGGFLSFR